MIQMKDATIVISPELWSAVASGARHRFGTDNHIQSAVAASLCRRTPSIEK